MEYTLPPNQTRAVWIHPGPPESAVLRHSLRHSTNAGITRWHPDHKLAPTEVTSQKPDLPLTEGCRNPPTGAAFKRQARSAIMGSLPPVAVATEYRLRTSGPTQPSLEEPTHPSVVTTDPRVLGLGISQSGEKTGALYEVDLSLYRGLPRLGPSMGTTTWIHAPTSSVNCSFPSPMDHK